ncbi:hypothetical protein [Jiangella rhizosphaerae]|uniref:Uncharacterized protein n=1 Tax=Jiangella rhizosphaerae TaxID=2293569 RepID=A0A418KVW1_9ACTN|nr:hypothetical protein [Jiangella rhizosphaerae]RIQ33617.1 hypothetical protein DY240_04930 [Jiangella rhizosphaerae]
MPDDHRSPSRDLSRRRHGEVDLDVGPSASTLDGSFDGSAERPWHSWERVPAEVTVVLEHHGCVPRDPFVAGATAPRARRRGEVILQRAGAWAVDQSRLVLIDAIRGVESLDGKRFRPSTPWRLGVSSYPFVGEVRKRSGTVPVDVPVGTAAHGDEPLDDPDGPEIIELLPAPVRRQILTTIPDPDVAEEYLYQGLRNDIPQIHEAGLLRATGATMIALHALRSIKVPRRMRPAEAEAALAAAPWYVQTLTATLGAVERTELTSFEQDRSIAANKPPQLAGADADRRELR